MRNKAVCGKKLWRLVLLAGVFSVFLTTCGKDAQEKNAKESGYKKISKEILKEDETARESISGESAPKEDEAAKEPEKDSSLEWTVPGCDIEGKELDSVYQEKEILEYHLQVPDIVLSGESARATMEAVYEEAGWEFEEQKQQAYWYADDSYHEDIQYEADRGDVINYYYTDYRITQNDEDYISLVKADEEYLGGAHGSYTLTGMVWDAKTGEALSLDDLLGNGEAKKAYLAEYLSEQFLKNEDGTLSDGYGMLWDDYDETIFYQVAFNPNFYIENDELVFIFNQYELAAYAAGTQFAKVPLNLLSELEEELVDEERALSYLERMKKPESLNKYLVEIPVGEVFYVDLDADGEEEEIIYSNYSNNSALDGTQIQLQIDGMIYQYYIDENIIEEYIGLLDMNTEDGKYELAAYAQGSSDDPVTVIYHYVNDSLAEIGRIPNILDRQGAIRGSYYLFGAGEVYGEMRIYGPLETRTVDVTWELDAEYDMINQKEQSFYSYDNNEGFVSWREYNQYQLLDSIVLYADPVRDGDYSIVEKEGNRVTQFYGSDGENWLSVEVLADGKLCWGWIYVNGWQVETKKEVFVSAQDVIENLMLAG